MELIITRDYDALSRAAFEVMKKILDKKESPILGLATGSTPVGLYQEMIRDHRENGRSYDNVTTWNLDEYVGIDRDDDQSYHTFMKEELFDGIEIPMENTHVPFGSSEKEALAYDEAMPAVDVQVLGLGENGHIGFNEPGTPFESRTHITDLTESTRNANKRFFENREVPTKAITQGIGTIMDADSILILASGPKKAQAVKDMIEGEIDVICPASILRTHPNVTVIVDEEAASLLEGNDK